MNIRDIRNDLMSYLGVSSTSSLPTQDQTDILRAYNAALQSMMVIAERFVRSDQIALNSREVRTITADVTKNSTTIANVTGWDSGMAYCSAVAAGDTITNRIISSTELLRPYTGETGTGVNIEVYTDVFTLDQGIMAVTDPVWHGEGYELSPIQNEHDRLALFRSYHTFYDYNRSYNGVYFWGNANSGMTYFSAPLAYWVERWNDRLRLFTWPTSRAQNIITAMVERGPTRLASFAAMDTDTSPEIPADFIESVFLPLAREKLLTNPHFRPETVRRDIQTAAGDARTTLRRLKPQRESGGAFHYAGFPY